ncbi:hypothetical protein H9L12_12540 [Sphingomonas rhizophila]|jgi:hypothetical protein|uniref:Uncharacterized protein n=1 Tax=Sphingomonas rhizophila TaxID=2071607 RepID=A0A7G9SAX9_9SPHN|nr:hypothetical protein [Sphingomonas rhizophila]QNN65004.1 hypothetical protein H9L12_12540 [Sphingomonas rhizophila]
MTRVVKTVLLVGAVAFAATAATAAFASTGGDGDKKTPSGFSYDIKDGKRVPKAGNRVNNADGSWREETKKGGCTEVKEMSAAGELKITRTCS